MCSSTDDWMEILDDVIMTPLLYICPCDVGRGEASTMDAEKEDS